jgi:hypothetical protein
MPTKAKVFLAVVMLLGLAAVVAAGASWQSVPSVERLLAYVALTAVASAVKLRLPGLEGTYSLNAVFLLAGAVYFSLPETVLAAVAAVLVQSYFRALKRPTPIQTLFNLSNECFSVAVASIGLSYLVSSGVWPFRPALLAGAAALSFILNTGIVSGILSLLGGRAFLDVNKQWYTWSFPYYLLGAAVVGIAPLDGRPVDLDACVVLVPLAYLAHFFCGLAEGRAPAEAGAGGPRTIPAAAKAFTMLVAAGAVSFLLFAASRPEPIEAGRFAAYLLLATLTATWKVRMPGMSGNISVQYVVVLVALAQCTLIEALVIAAVGPLVQSYWKAKAPVKPVQLLFNIATIVVSTGITYLVCRTLAWGTLGQSLLAFLACAAAVQFAGNTLLLAIVLSLVKQAPLTMQWRQIYFWTFPVYMVGAAAAGVIVAASRAAGWAPGLLVLPLMAMAQLSYGLHLSLRSNPARARDGDCQAA